MLTRAIVDSPDTTDNGRIVPETNALNWSPIQRIAFRFWFLYFGLFCVGSQPIDGFVPLVDVDPLCDYWPVSAFISWTAVHVFRFHGTLVFHGSGSGDKVTDWLFQFCLLAFCVLGATVWSLLDRKRENYDTLYKWFRLFIRLALASQLISYGLVKLIPEQMPYPALTGLLEPFGRFSPMGVLWRSIGASPSYEMFAGSAELLAGLLLVVPRTTMLGALIGVADMTQVFALNMTYDVPVKLLSLHLLLLCLFLLGPDLRRLADLFLFDRPVGRSSSARLVRNRRGYRILLAAQIAFGIYLVAANVSQDAGMWSVYGGARPKSPLFGIWNIQNLVADDRVLAPLVTTHYRWRRLIFDSPGSVTFQRMDDSFVGYGASIDAKERTLVLTNGEKSWKARYIFRRIGRDRLVLAGNLNRHKIRMQLQLEDPRKWALLATGFHWVADYPFNR